MPRVDRNRAGVPASHEAARSGEKATAVCPFCSGGPVSVIDSRHAENHSHTRRVRVCRACKVRWTTYEVTDAEMLELVELRKWKTEMLALIGPPRG